MVKRNLNAFIEHILNSFDSKFKTKFDEEIKWIPQNKTAFKNKYEITPKMEDVFVVNCINVSMKNPLRSKPLTEDKDDVRNTETLTRIHNLISGLCYNAKVCELVFHDKFSKQSVIMNIFSNINQLFGYKNFEYLKFSEHMNDFGFDYHKDAIETFMNEGLEILSITSQKSLKAYYNENIMKYSDKWVYRTDIIEEHAEEIKEFNGTSWKNQLNRYCESEMLERADLVEFGVLYDVAPLYIKSTTEKIEDMIYANFCTVDTELVQKIMDELNISKSTIKSVCKKNSWKIIDTSKKKLFNELKIAYKNYKALGGELTWNKFQPAYKKDPTIGQQLIK